GLRQSAENVEEGGLAAARRAHHAEEFSSLHLEGDAAHRRHVHFADAIGLADILDLNNCRHRCVCPSYTSGHGGFCGAVRDPLRGWLLEGAMRRNPRMPARSAALILPVQRECVNRQERAVQWLQEGLQHGGGHDVSSTGAGCAPATPPVRTYPFSTADRRARQCERPACGNSTAPPERLRS